MNPKDAETIKIYEPGTRGRCPHCLCIVFFAEAEKIQDTTYYSTQFRLKSGGDYVHVYSSKCPNCLKPIVAAEIEVKDKTRKRLIHPFGATRVAPWEVPEHIREDFQEATEVMQVSEKASAALSRRCLQSVLLDQGAPKGNLNEQIDWAIQNLHLPLKVAENLDYIRNVGNFAVHETKYLTTDEIVDVEPEEASWNLDVLESLFEYCYVQPSEADKKREKLDEKLDKAGKTSQKRNASTQRDKRGRD